MAKVLTYKELASGEILATGMNLTEVMPNEEKVRNYLDSIKDLTGAQHVEFNNTLIAVANGKCYYSFEKKAVEALVYGDVEIAEENLGAWVKEQTFRIIPLSMEGEVVVESMMDFPEGTLPIAKASYAEDGDILFETEYDVFAYVVDMLSSYLEQVAVSGTEHILTRFYERESAHDFNGMYALVKKLNSFFSSEVKQICELFDPIDEEFNEIVPDVSNNVEE